MKQRKVVHGKNLAMRSPVLTILVFWLVLDRLDAPGWVWGVVGTIAVVLLLAWIVDIFNIEHIEVIK